MINGNVERGRMNGNVHQERETVMYTQEVAMVMKQVVAL